MFNRCPKCGNMVGDGERFCTKCGENLDTLYQSQGFSGQPAYNNTYQSLAGSSDMSFGNWVVTVLVTNLFGLISWIFLFVWGFGSGPEVRKKYCKAMLIVKGISLAISMIFAVVYMGFIGNIINNYYNDYYDNNGYYYDDGNDDDYELTIDV